MLFSTLGLTASRLIKPSKSVPCNPIKELTKLLKFSWPIYVASITSFLYTWYGKALILAYLSITALGIYHVLFQ